MKRRPKRTTSPPGSSAGPTKADERPRTVRIALAGVAVVCGVVWAVLHLAAPTPDASGQKGRDQNAVPSNEQPIVAGGWRLPAEIPSTVVLRPPTWIGRPLEATELGRWTDTALFPRDATIVLYYASCSHCAEHLRELAALQAKDPSSAPTYVLVQLPTPKAYTGRLFVDTLPTAVLTVELPSVVPTWVMTPPWEVVVAGGVVRGASQPPR
jgi:hypothetical protein